MGSLSIWHLLILLIIFGTPFAMYFVIASGSRSNLRKPSAFLHTSFLVSILGIVAMVVTTIALKDPDTESIVVGAIFITSIAAGWTYLMAIAILATRTGRSGILWAGLTFITSPIGVLVSYPMMVGVLRKHEKHQRNAV